MPRRAALRTIGEEFGEWHFRRSLGLAATRLLPALVGNRLRTAVLRLAGVSIGKGTTVGGRLDIVGDGALEIGRNCWINARCHIDVSASVSIGEGVALAQEVMILTNTHAIGGTSRRAGGLENRPVTIGDGCWIGARAVVLPGVTIGAGSIVAAGAVVASDVEPNTLVAGVPTRLVQRLD